MLHTNILSIPLFYLTNIITFDMLNSMNEGQGITINEILTVLMFLIVLFSLSWILSGTWAVPIVILLFFIGLAAFYFAIILVIGTVMYLLQRLFKVLKPY